MDAVVFDMDGVLVDSQHQWELAETPLLRSFAPDWREADHPKISGLGVDDLHRWLVKEYRVTRGLHEFRAACEAEAGEIYGRRASLAEGLLDCLAAFKARGLPLAVDSYSPRAWIWKRPRDPPSSTSMPRSRPPTRSRSGQGPGRCISSTPYGPGCKGRAQSLYCAAWRGRGHCGPRRG
jgi:hypothetical protein